MLQRNHRTIKTPENLSIVRTTETATKAVITEELKDYGEWTPACTTVLESCLSMIFKYDKLEYAVARAFGSSEFKIVLNPFRIFCYHPTCIKKERTPITLVNTCRLDDFLKHISMTHNDVMGKAMYKRFLAINDDMFCSDFGDCPSPYSLLDPVPRLEPKSVNYLRKFSIHRNLSTTYICHWKDAVIRCNLLSPQSLSFQEDDALVHLITTYPHPVSDWKEWKTLSLYMMKFFTSVSGTGANLYRGYTYYPNLNKEREHSLEQFIKEINHPGRSITTLGRWLPSVSFDTEQEHKVEQLCHIKFLMNNTDAIKLSFEKVVRYPVVLGADEQELNQGTFKEDGILHGLLKQLTAADIVNIGYTELANYIQTSNPFISCVREYRLIDLKGIFSSNVATSFLAKVLVADECELRLNTVRKLANSCLECLLHDVSCSYTLIGDRCKECSDRNLICISLLIIHVLWDMGSSHKKMSKNIKKIDKSSTDADYAEARLSSIGFGGLHLAKAFTNSMRNNSLTLQGSNYGVYVLRALRNTPGNHSVSLRSIKTAVFVGKDRQSDYLSYMTSSKLVQEALAAAKHYACTRSPEPVLRYTENAKKHKKLVFPPGLVCNSNGEPFILDAGSASLLQRSSVAKMAVIGNYMQPSVQEYKADSTTVQVHQLRFSNNLCDLVINMGTLFVVDAGRQEVVIIPKVSIGSQISSYAFIIKKTRVVSVACWKEYLVCLCIGLTNQLTNQPCNDQLEILEFDIPTKPKEKSLYLQSKTIKVTKLPFKAKIIFSVDEKVGIWTTEKELILCYNLKVDSPGKIVFKNLCLSSIMKPIIDGSKMLIQPPSTKSVKEIEIVTGKKSKDLTTTDAVHIRDLPSNVHYVTKWGETWFYIVKDDGVYKVDEHGSLEFGIRLSQSLNTFYEAISYIPPHGYKTARKLTLKECIRMGNKLVTVLSDAQSECKQRFPSKNAFHGAHGAVATDTLKSLNSTVESWEALCSRLDHFDPNLKDEVVPFMVQNEAPVERSFGFTDRVSSDPWNPWKPLESPWKGLTPGNAPGIPWNRIWPPLEPR